MLVNASGRQMAFQLSYLRSADSSRKWIRYGRGRLVGICSGDSGRITGKRYIIR